jgi:hypothetical protein
VSRIDSAPEALELAELTLIEASASDGGADAKSPNSAVRACETSLIAILALALDDDEADDAELADDVDEAEDVDEEDELEVSAARRSVRSVSSADSRLLTLVELALESDEELELPVSDAAGGPGGGPPAGGAPEGPSEPSCDRKARTVVDTPTPLEALVAVEAVVDCEDVLVDVAELELDWLF